MQNYGPLAMTSLILNLVALKNLILKGLVSPLELREQIDMVLLLLEESGLVSGDDGRAVHANLQMVMSIVSGEATPKPT